MCFFCLVSIEFYFVKCNLFSSCDSLTREDVQFNRLIMCDLLLLPDANPSPLAKKDFKFLMSRFFHHYLHMTLALSSLADKHLSLFLVLFILLFDFK